MYNRKGVAGLPKSKKWELRIPIPNPIPLRRDQRRDEGGVGLEGQLFAKTKRRVRILSESDSRIREEPSQLQWTQSHIHWKKMGEFQIY